MKFCQSGVRLNHRSPSESTLEGYLVFFKLSLKGIEKVAVINERNSSTAYDTQFQKTNHRICLAQTAHHYVYE